ncbi:hypothetical protein VTL71DRAFT_700 [Oculimacula yallundae]|uniref:Uncharacterized protein n=1 Tax=Oculimacula yallundae TaxID=86028 RepID=A0ABR4D0U0_9HELO
MTGNGNLVWGGFEKGNVTVCRTKRRGTFAKERRGKESSEVKAGAIVRAGRLGSVRLPEPGEQSFLKIEKHQTPSRHRGLRDDTEEAKTDRNHSSWRHWNLRHRNLGTSLVAIEEDFPHTANGGPMFWVPMILTHTWPP